MSTKLFGFRTRIMQPKSDTLLSLLPYQFILNHRFLRKIEAKALQLEVSTLSFSDLKSLVYGKSLKNV